MNAQTVISHPVYVGSDNRFPVRFRTRNLLTDSIVDVPFATITRAVVSLSDGTELIDTTSLGAGEVVDLSDSMGIAYFRLGALATLPAPGEYEMRFKVYEGGTDTEPTVLLHEDHPLQKIVLSVVEA